MSSKLLALFIGGIVPAIGLGIGALFQRYAGEAGMATGPFLIVTGAVVAVVGMFFCFTEQDLGFSAQGAFYTLLFAVCWGISSGSISYSLRKMGASLSQIVPLYNMNTLIAVLIAIIVLAEWRTIHVPQILLATILIIAGGILASRASL